MKNPSPLRYMSLAYLDSLPNRTASRYEVMININRFFAQLDKPYSPGAFYHEINKQAELSLININQNEISASSITREWLAKQFTTSPLPSSILGKAAFLAAAALLVDPAVRQAAIRRLEVDMIKLNHIAAGSDLDASTPEWATTTCLSNLQLGLKRAVLDISA